MQFLVTDLFCGAGGTSTGFHSSGLAKVIACVNHDAGAIESHALNHPDTVHFTEDIRTIAMRPLVDIQRNAKAQYPDAKTVLWASLECTQFSVAKGGQSRDADSRTLAEHLFRYIKALDPDYIMIENVVEFRSWGPLRVACATSTKEHCELKTYFNKKSGQEEYVWVPANTKAGTDWLRWVDEINEYGYRDSWRELNAADFGAYTSRNRLFGMFAKQGLPITWPEPTHSKKATGNLFTGLRAWRPVKEVLDFEDEGKSIFGREKPLSDNTLKRIYAGLEKFVPKNERQWLLKWTSMNGDKHNAPGLNEPAPVVTTQNRLGLLSVDFLYSYYGASQSAQSIDAPAPTLTTKDRVARVSCFLVSHYSGGFSTSMDSPSPTIVNTPKQSLIQASQGMPVVEPLDTDTPMMAKVKEFMRTHGIADIKMRMLRVPELLKIQGFPDGYHLAGNQSDQKKFIGNSVCPVVAEAITRALASEFDNDLRRAV